MPTSHPRIALTRDPELDDALRRARPLLDKRGERMPTAKLARALILRGSRDLLSTEGSELDLWLDERDATPARRSTQELLSTASRRRRSTGRITASEALEELRSERL